MYYLCSENKGTDQLRSYCAADLHLYFCIFFLMAWLIYLHCFSESENAQSLMVKKQLNDLKEENESLKSSVHRLSVELSSYQAQYRPINPEQTVSGHQTFVLKIGKI